MEPTHKISSKKSGKKKAAMTANRPVIAEIKPDKPFLVITDVHALIITAIVFAIEYTFSFYHTSMYQGEEGAHYMNMKAFWHDPTLVLLGTWAKTGWKIMYAL